jgi:hemoglobin/transferrin/lactoferrin receptor protein
MLGGVVALPAAAQTPTNQPQGTVPVTVAPVPTQLDAVTSAATRTKRPLDAVPGTVSIITNQDIDRDNRTNIRDLVRDEPGINVGNQNSRGGLTNFVIRGIGGNRVLVIVDGLRVPDMPGTNSGGGNYTRDFVDIESIKRVEIIRGPASALYGSDAIGGVVAYTTKDPSDYLTPDKNIFGSVKAGYSLADNGFYETLTGVARAGSLEVLGLYTRRDFHETRTWNGPAPSGYTALGANPQNNWENSFLFKTVWRPTDADIFRVIGEYTDKVVKTRVNSNIGTANGLVANIYDEWGADRAQRYRLSGQWEHNAPIGFVDRVDLMVYYSGIFRSEDSTRLQSPTSGTIPTQLRIAYSVSTQDIWGAELQMETKTSIFDAANYFTYGASFSYTKTSRPRNRVQITLATGVTTPNVAGELYPNKNFPDTDTMQAGIYLQDEIVAGNWTVTPAVRLDYYGLRASPDQMFWNSNGGIQAVPTDSNYFSVSPKLGAIYRFTQEYSAYGQYSRGFRAPPYDNANFGFTNSASFYQITPNATLRPETADSFEVGVRGKYAGGSSFALTGFYNVYKDFIDSVTVVSPPAPGITIFQFQNRPTVNIWGFEARGEYRFDPEWSLLGYFAYANGTDASTGSPIDSVDPWKLQARVRYGGEVGLGAQLIGTLVGQHTQVANSAPNAQPFFQAPAYFNLDATVSYAWTPHFKVNAGAFNITNAKYWNAADVIGLNTTNPQLDLYAQPARYFGVNLTARW